MTWHELGAVICVAVPIAYSLGFIQGRFDRVDLFDRQREALRSALSLAQLTIATTAEGVTGNNSESPCSGLFDRQTNSIPTLHDWMQPRAARGLSEA